MDGQKKSHMRHIAKLIIYYWSFPVYVTFPWRPIWTSPLESSACGWELGESPVQQDKIRWFESLFFFLLINENVRRIFFKNILIRVYFFSIIQEIHEIENE